MLAAMISILSGKAVDPRIGMTGEITLSGRVLPVGGIREKVLAAHRAGLKCVVLPKRNEQDLEEVPEDIRAALEFVFVRTIDELLDFVFDAKAKPAGAARTGKKPRAAGSRSRKKGLPRKQAAAGAARKRGSSRTSRRSAAGGSKLTTTGARKRTGAPKRRAAGRKS